MFSFYTIVTIVAIVLLIIALTIVGLALRNNSRANEFPDYQYLCPDLWKLDPDNVTCRPQNFVNNPVIQPINMGSSTQLYPNTKSIVHDGVKISNDKTRITSLNIDDDKWTSVCDKSSWATRNKILWDGVANNNTCV